MVSTRIISPLLVAHKGVHQYRTVHPRRTACSPSLKSWKVSLHCDLAFVQPVRTAADEKHLQNSGGLSIVTQGT